MLNHGGQALWTEVQLLLHALRDWQLALSLGLFAILLLLAAQAPLDYRIAIGQEDGPSSDLPLVAGFWPPERDVHGDFRWTTGRATVRLPGVGQRPLQIILTVFPINAEVAQRGPRAIELWASGRSLGQLPVRPAGAIYRFLVPPPADGSGDQVIELRSATFIPTGDERAIGTPVDALYVAAPPGPTLPAWRRTLAWLGAALMLWLALRRAGFGPRAVQALLVPAALLAGLAALLDPPRFALGGDVALTVLALGWLLVLLLSVEPPGLLLAGAVLAVVAGGLWMGGHGGNVYAGGALQVAAALVIAGWLRPAVAALYRRYAPPLAPGARRWLLLLALVVFATRYGGKIYPDAMPGDIGFHVNRYADVVRGSVLLLSRNRGVDFPYPPALYLLLAPLSLLGLDRRVQLQLGAAVLDALSVFLMYTLAAGALSCAKRPVAHPEEPPGSDPIPARSYTLPLLAAGIYGLSPAGLMTTWWNFSTHIFAQFTHLLLITALVLLWRWAAQARLLLPASEQKGGEEKEDVASVSPLQWRASALAARASRLRSPRSALPSLDPRGGWWAMSGGLVVLQLLVYLGHFGFWINMSLLGVIGLAAVLGRRHNAGRRMFRLLLASFVAAELLAVLLFYSNYTGLFLTQARATAAGGLTGLAGRAPVDRTILWATLWDAGFRAHFGFFPLPLALCGLFLLHQRIGRQHPAPAPAPGHRGSLGSPCAARVVLMAGTFTVGLLFAILPFLSGSTLATRWLMFSAWAIAVGAAVSAQLLWRAGRAGRLLVLAAGGYVLWVTASMWLEALAWRVRPPEPF